MDLDRILRKNPRNSAALAMRRELDAFFSSAWFRHQPAHTENRLDKLKGITVAGVPAGQED